MISTYILSFFINSAHAYGPLLSVVQDVTHAQNLVKEAGVMSTGCDNYTPSTREIKNAPLALQCLNSLCPKDDSAAIGSSLNPYLLSKISPKHREASEKKFNQKKNDINKTIDDYIQSSTALVAQVEQLQQSPTIEVDKSNLVALLDQYLGLRNTGSTPAIDINNTEKIKPETLVLVNSLKKQSEAFLSKNPDIMKRLSSDFENVDLKKDTRELINKYKEKNEMGMAAILQKDLDSPYFDGYELTKKIIFSEAIVNSPTLQKDSQAFLQKKLKEIDTNLIKKSFNTHIKDSIPKLIKSNYLYKEAHNCDPLQFKKMVKEIKDNYKKNVFPKFSPETRKRLAEYLDQDVKFAIDEKSFFPEDGESALLKALKLQTQTINKNLSDKATNEIVSYAFRNYADYKGIPTIEFESPNLTDHFKNDLRSFGETNISALSCANPEIGRGVITHEIGHAISSLFQMGMSENPEDNDVVKNFRPNPNDYKKFLKTRECIADYHVNLTPVIEDPMHPGDSFRVEEDMADWFVAQASGGNKNFTGCALLVQSSDWNINYTDLEFLNDKTFRDDTHSAAFFRVLNEAFQGNNLGLKCESFVKQNEHLIRLKKCQ
jgi:hypothetical protein